jgi:hypothetical protein
MRITDRLLEGLQLFLGQLRPSSALQVSQQANELGVR